MVHFSDIFLNDALIESLNQTAKPYKSMSLYIMSTYNKKLVLNTYKAWFSYATDLLAAYPSVLPGILFPHTRTYAGSNEVNPWSFNFTAGMPAKLT